MMEQGDPEPAKFEISSTTGVIIQDTRNDSFSAEREGKEERMGAEADIYRLWRKLREFSLDGIRSILSAKNKLRVSVMFVSLENTLWTHTKNPTPIRAAVLTLKVIAI